MAGRDIGADGTAGSRRATGISSNDIDSALPGDERVDDVGPEASRTVTPSPRMGEPA